MPRFNVAIERTQSQCQFFTVEADDQSSLEKKLEKLEIDGEFAQIDERFDEGNVESIEYTVLRVGPTKDKVTTFASEELQNLLDNCTYHGYFD